MPTLDDHYAAQKKLGAARRELHAIAEQLTRLAGKLLNEQGVRMNELTTYPSGLSSVNHASVDRSEYLDWSRIEAAIRAFTEADDASNRISMGLTSEQRRETRG